MLLIDPDPESSPTRAVGDSGRRILLVEDPSPVRDALVAAVRAVGNDIRTTTTKKETVHQLHTWQPDLVLLDLEADRRAGLETCRHIVGFAPVPILVLAPVDEPELILAALESGATDYATRPIDGHALLVRIRTTLARTFAAAVPDSDEVVQVGPLTIEPTSRRVSVRGRPVHFAKMEYDVLLALAQRPGQIRTAEELLEEVWAGRQFEDPRTLNTHIRRIRMKLEIDPARPEHLVTVRGVGYYFNGGHGGPRRDSERS